MRKPRPKPCPFCRSADVFVERFETAVFAAVCNGCLIHGPKVEHGKYADEPNGDELAERDALRMWNARTQAARQRVLVSCEMIGIYALDIDAGADRPATADDIEVSDEMRAAGLAYLMETPSSLIYDESFVAEMFRVMVLAAKKSTPR